MRTKHNDDMGLDQGENREQGTPEEYQSPQEDMFRAGEGRRDDGSIGLPKITMKTIRANPARCNEGDGARVKIATFTGVANGIQQAAKPDTGEVFFGLKGDFAAVRFDRDGEPEAIFKADTLYFPIGHQAALNTLERTGQLSFALEFYAQPASNPAGYSWSYNNLAKLDRNNLSPIDKLITLSVKAGRELAAAGPAVGLLADLRQAAE